jgi:hypothetical protein
MNINKRKEDFNKAMVRAVAAATGWTVADWSQDMDLFDTTISKVLTNDGYELPRTVDFQLKCTESPTTDNAEFVSFSLENAHYEKLKKRITGAPFMLCIAVVPENSNDWCEFTTGVTQTLHNDMILRHCLYARILYDYENLLDDSSKTVRFYKGKDEFSVPNIEKLEKLLSSKEYNLAKAKAEKAFWEART